MVRKEKMISKDEAIDILEKMSFFNQRAARELWNDKSKEIQDEDIANRESNINKLIEFIND